MIRQHLLWLAGTQAERTAYDTTPLQPPVLWYETDTAAWYFWTGAAWAALGGGGAPAPHAASHQQGGADAVGTATPTANAIPEADAAGTLESWVHSRYTDAEAAAVVETYPGVYSALDAILYGGYGGKLRFAWLANSRQLFGDAAQLSSVTENGWTTDTVYGNTGDNGPYLDTYGNSLRFYISHHTWQNTGVQPMVVWGWCTIENNKADGVLLSKHAISNKAWRLGYIGGKFQFIVSGDGNTDFTTDLTFSVSSTDWLFFAGSYYTSAFASSASVHVAFATDTYLTSASDLGAPSSIYASTVALYLGCQASSYLWPGKVGICGQRTGVSNLSSYAQWIFDRTKHLYGG